MVFLRRLFKNRKWLIPVMFLIISVSVVNITLKREYVFKSLETPLLTALSPVQKTLSDLGFTIRETLNTIPQFFYLKQENEALKNQVAELLQYKQNLVEYQKENQELRSLLGFRNRSFQYDLEAA